jgi:sulfur relay (sulfurtransferase) complex TusBCD TusD component (DsrE family)
LIEPRRKLLYTDGVLRASINQRRSRVSFINLTRILELLEKNEFDVKNEQRLESGRNWR